MTLNHTSKSAITSFLFFAISVGFAGGVYWLIISQGERLKEETKVIGTNQLVEEQLMEMQRILDDTESDRQLLSEYLLTEGKTINFLSEIEMLAGNLGLNFTTDTLKINELPSAHFDEVEVNFTAHGDRDSLIAFLSTVENLPYYSWVSDLNFVNKDSLNPGSSWEAKITLKVGVHDI